MESDRIKWDQRYAGEEFKFSRTPSRFLARMIDQACTLVKGRRALDVACGEGRNAIFLTQKGFQVTGIDISERGLERARRRAAEEGVQIEFIQADLEEYRLQDVYDMIVNFNFLLRSMIPEMIACLAPGGVILMDTILNDPSLNGEHCKEYLLQQGELERLFCRPDGTILLYEEDLSHGTPVARIMFRKHP